jgi:hypothetical protein
LSRTIIKALLIFFAVFTLISLIFLAYATQIPTEEVTTNTLCNYTQDGTYDYIAALGPNLIYSNKTTLGPGEGIIYISITKYITVTFTYTFESDLTANTTIRYTASEFVVTPRWTRQTYSIPLKTIIKNTSNETSFQFSIPPITIKSMDTLVGSINSEIGVSTGNYNITIATTATLNAETEAGTINEQFTASLLLGIQRGATEGDIVSVGNLQTTKTGEITQTETTYYDWVKNQQYASYITSATALIGLAICAFFYIQTKPPVAPPPSEKLIQELTEPYQDIIVEVAQEQTPQGQTTITTKTLEDLVKIADTLTKPIVHFQKPPTPENQEPTDIFYVLDNITRYEYRVTPSKIKAAQQILEESEEGR